jgi:hypothetical protein
LEIETLVSNIAFYCVDQSDLEGDRDRESREGETREEQRREKM